MAITIIIDNHGLDQRTVIFIGYDDVHETETVWNTIHPVSNVLVKHGIVDKLLTWAEMDIRHYQLLIKKQLEQYVNLEVAEQHNINHKVVNTLRFLMCAYIRKLSELTGSDVDVIRVQKVGPADFSFNVSLNLHLTSSKATKGKKKPEFKVIVDNTKDDE